MLFSGRRQPIVQSVVFSWEDPIRHKCKVQIPVTIPPLANAVRADPENSASTGKPGRTHLNRHLKTNSMVVKPVRCRRKRFGLDSCKHRQSHGVDFSQISTEIGLWSN